jgi:hypothetical protein
VIVIKRSGRDCDGSKMDNKENRSKLNGNNESTLSVLDNDDETSSSAIHALMAISEPNAYNRDSISQSSTESSNNDNQLHHPPDIRNVNIPRPNQQNQNKKATIPLCTVINSNQASNSSVPRKGHFEEYEKASTLTALEEEEKGKGNRDLLGSRKCEYEDCDKCAQGSTKFCIKHGGGRRCTVEGCNKGARDKNFCAGHGGGKRLKQNILPLI